MHSLLLVLLLSSPSEPRQTQNPPGQQQPAAPAQIAPVVQATNQERIAEYKRRYGPGILRALKNPEWWQVALIIGGTLLAWRAFASERDAVRLTERADVLINSVLISDLASYGLHVDSVVDITFKNFGRTRASDLHLSGRIGFDNGILIRHPPLVLGAGDTQRLVFDRLGSFMTHEDAMAINNGVLPLKVTAKAEYTDVFGQRHTTISEAIYRWKFGVFVASSYDAD